MKKIYFVLIGLFLNLSVNAQVINFPDLNLKNYLLSANETNTIAIDGNFNYITIDTNGDNEIEVSEAANTLIYGLNIANTNISNTSGLEYFVNIKYISFSNNNLLPTIDLSGLVNLTDFGFYNNAILNTVITTGLVNVSYVNIEENPQLLNLNFNNLLGLLGLYCTQLQSLNLNGLPLLKDVTAYNCNLQTVSLVNLPNFERAFLNNNFLSNITLSNLPKLWVLEVSDNQLTSIDFSNVNMIGDNINGTQFYGSNNLFTSLDFSQAKFRAKDVSNNQLVYLNLKDFFMSDGEVGMELKIENNPNLQFICVNDEIAELEPLFVQDLVNQNGYTNCVVNSYCNFNPGGIFYNISGTNTIDLNDNGCDVNDVSYPFLKLTVANETSSRMFLSGYDGNYTIPVNEGSYTITPNIENTNFFTISPANFNATFPTDSSPFNQNFCLIPNGVHSDIEVVVVPLIPARPGFDSKYKIIYKNKGNSNQSGFVTFSYEDAKMDLIFSTPVASNQSTGILTFDYIDLQPFETRDIFITMNINSPQETPSVNIGDQLNFTAIVYPLLNDENLEDNTSGLKQIVVGSYDPNDKTCVEGNVVGPEMIGHYVHYVIRFENTGTFPAENVVVKDMIDLTKFDLTSLIPTSASHSFVTRIANDGKVEFIFENIQLPFDDATNDGYVAFKIKTLPSLIVGDTFSNEANIYFDYNFPIETNTTSTIIQALATNDFEFSIYFNLYPNPVKNNLTINSNNNIIISSINIYNALGQLILVETNPNASIDVSNLKLGTYFIKVVSDKGTCNTKFIKE